MASSTNVESPPIGEGSNNVNNSETPATAAAVNSPATTAAAVNSPTTPAAVNSPGTAEDVTKTSEITPNGRRSKKQKLDSSTGGDHRREREEWSDTAIAILLDSYTEKFMALNRSNLRGKDWEVVAELVAESGDKQPRKSIEQCKNKIDNLKKRYKLETQRMEINGSASSWVWFKKMDIVFGSLMGPKSGAGTGATSDDDKSVGASSPHRLRRSARLAPTSAPVRSNFKTTTNIKWKRVVFKVSGTALAGSGQSIDPKLCRLQKKWQQRPGMVWSMMATVMNSVLLQSALEKLGIQTRVQSAFLMPEIAEPYNRLRAMRHLDKGRVVIFVNADAVIKGTNVNGICDKHKVPLDQISFRDAVSRDCGSMDLMAIQFCEENSIPVVIFNMLERGNVAKALTGGQVGTLIDQ
ncbi:Aspartate/glutamate/uridylate kinase [Cynara cardunculus var. scolymus]|uniref:Aspartate/glutamate/uridylate kinase n=1 Tax=Cynara cardunculus var. scolymus TaxID=59895 RepID=A0A118K4E9_CYNCS|nr:Aspartate/glutamate/uridylate kinase [Cynara cardunculus var. scolymus]